MSQLILSRGNTRGFLKRFFANFEMGPVFLIGSLVLSVALITIITLMFSAQQVTKGYVLNELESRHQELIRQREVKEMEMSNAKSLKFIEQSSRVRYMVKPPQVVFMDTDHTIAAR